MSGKTQTDISIIDRPVEEAGEKQDKERDILESLLLNKVIQKPVKTSRGYFTLRYPSGKDRLKIDKLRALRRHGIPAECFDDVANANNNIWSTLDVTVVDGPDWYNKIRKDNSMWSWEEGPDEELIIELYDLVSTFRTNITEKIRNSKLGRTVEEIPVADITAPVDNGAFQGLTNGSKN
jgi:hypothetical protein